MAEQKRPKIYRKRQYKDRKDILNLYDDDELVKRYRLDREGIILVTDMVRDAIEPRTMRNRAITAEIKVLATLHFLATGKLQLYNGDDLGLTQQSVSKAINETLNAMVTPAFMTQFIKFPTSIEDIQQNQAEFMEKYGFRGVIGVIDGTHIRILCPTENEVEFVNHKHYHSLNAQVVFDANNQILDVVAKWPGSVHDSRIWNECGLKQLFQRGIIPAGAGFLLGDRGYPCQRWLLTPFPQPETEAQEAYNRRHKQTMCVSERGIGQLKQRFQVLHKEIRLAPNKTSKIIMVCAALHNLCKQRNLDIPNLEEEEHEQEDEPDQPLPADQPEDGLQFRNHIVNQDFSHGDGPPEKGDGIIITDVILNKDNVTAVGAGTGSVHDIADLQLQPDKRIEDFDQVINSESLIEDLSQMNDSIMSSPLTIQVHENFEMGDETPQLNFITPPTGMCASDRQSDSGSAEILEAQAAARKANEAACKALEATALAQEAATRAQQAAAKAVEAASKAHKAVFRAMANHMSQGVESEKK